MNWPQAFFVSVIAICGTAAFISAMWAISVPYRDHGDDEEAPETEIDDDRPF